ncbi:hypothetical protein [Streptomyces sp. NPDC001348]
MARSLFLITAADHRTLADRFEQPSGFRAEEAIGPYGVFKEAGYEIAAATPGGIPPTADALSLTPDFNGGPEGAEQMKTALRRPARPGSHQGPRLTPRTAAHRKR